jgi:hypothetical protein
MAKKTVVVSDMSGETIPDGKGAKVRILFNDARKGARELDLTDAERKRSAGALWLEWVAARRPRASTAPCSTRLGARYAELPPVEFA